MNVKKRLSSILSCVLIYCMILGMMPVMAADTSLSPNDGEVLFSDDFEGYEVDKQTPSSSNVYAYGTTNWSGFIDGRAMTVYDGKTKNKVLKLYNYDLDATTSVDAQKSLNTASDPTDFRLDFDLKTMGNNIYCFLQEYGFLTSDVLVNFIGNKVQGQYVTTNGSKSYQDLMNFEYMQWNHVTVFCDVQANLMKLYINDEFVTEKIIYAKPPNPHTLRVIKFRADLSKGQEVYIDNVKVTRIKTSFTGTDTPGNPTNEDDGQPLVTGPSFGNQFDLGGVVRLGSAMKAAYGYDKDGNPEVYFVASGAPGSFCVVDAETGKLKDSKPIPGITRAWAVAKGPDGLIYFGGMHDGKIHSYDPITKKYSDVGVVSPTHKFLWHIVPGTNNKLYIAAYADKQDGHAIEYDITTKTFKDLGVMKEGADYVQGLYATDKYLYAGCGGNVKVQAIIQYNLETGEKKELPQNTRESGGTFVSRVRVEGGKILVGFGNSVFVINEENFELEDQFKTDITGGYVMVSPASPTNPDLVYYVYGKVLYSYNLKTKEKLKVADVPDNVMGTSQIGFDWVKLRDGRWAVAWMNGEMLNCYVVPEEGKAYPVPTDFGTSETGSFVTPVALRASKDDIIYIAGTEGATSAYDIKNKKVLFNIPNFQQIEGLAVWQGKVYYGTYTGAALYEYDPTKPVNYIKHSPEGNPRLIYDENDGQDRPFVVEPAGDKLLFGTVASYGKHDGAVLVCTKDNKGNPVTKAYVGVIKNQGVSGIAYKDGKIYASSTIMGGLGNDPIEKQAKVAIIDEATGKVEKEVVPDILKIGTKSSIIGKMSFGPDGLLWAVSDIDGTVFAMDPKTLEVVKSKSLFPGGAQGSKFVGHEIIWGDDGTMYTTAARSIAALNVETMESKTLFKGNRFIMYMCRDSEGNLYYQNGTSLVQLPINQKQRLRGIISSAEKMKKDDSFSEDNWNAFTNALAKAKEVPEDADLDTVKAASKSVANAMNVLKGIETVIPGGDNPGENTPGGDNPGENQPDPVTFKDMAGYEWAKTAVDSLVAKGVVKGKEEAVFAPGDSVTRAEFVKMVVGAYDIKKNAESNPFQDISSSDWFYDSVLAASSNHLISGIEVDRFGPEEQITREMAAVILYRICNLKQIKLSSPDNNIADFNDISDYAKEAVAVLYGSKFIAGTGNGYFSPKVICNRAEAAQLVYKCMQ